MSFSITGLISTPGRNDRLICKMDGDIDNKDHYPFNVGDMVSYEDTLYTVTGLEFSKRLLDPPKYSKNFALEVVKLSLTSPSYPEMPSIELNGLANIFLSVSELESALSTQEHILPTLASIKKELDFLERYMMHMSTLLTQSPRPWHEIKANPELFPKRGSK